MSKTPLIVHQANVFYNYTLGFHMSEVDLLKTAKKALKLGISSSAFFSDNKLLYLDDQGDIQLEWIQPEGRQWDSQHSVTFDKNLPKDVLENLVLALELSFHEDRFTSGGTNTMVPYLRLSLPPIVLKDSDTELPIFVSTKVIDDGVTILSFQVDGEWFEGVNEDYFINEVVNLFNRYFESVWVDSKIQKLEADLIIPFAFEDQITLAGKPLNDRKIKRMKKRMKKEAQETFRESIAKGGRTFTINESEVTLHKAAGTDNVDTWESNFDFCTFIYRNALSNLIVPSKNQQEFASRQPIHWQGRPSITLMRFKYQPDNKSQLLANFKESLLRILNRSTKVVTKSELPRDLRLIKDYTFHGTRALFLWTWIKPEESPDDAWEDPNTRSIIMSHQSRAEHIEYYNMRLARACKIARYPPSENHLIESYRVLSMAEDDLHHSGSAGEVTNALKTVIREIGTLELVPSAKESARWYLDEKRYKSEKRRLNVDRWMTFVFGLVGVTGISEFLLKPYVKRFLIEDTLWVPIVSFSIAATIVLLLILIIWFFNRR